MLEQFKALSDDGLLSVVGGDTLHEVEELLNGFVDGVTDKKRHYKKND
ncbi:hypothetical protein [Periweissella cryptocerci]|nr:hypothetical protein [Periweissella cryptocerci]